MRRITKVVVMLTFLLLTVRCSLLTVNAAVPHLINYQGRLTDTAGVPLNGTYTLTFRIYDAETAGNLLWQGTYSVSIQKGIFAVLLGDINDAGYNFANLSFDKAYFLEIKVGAEVMSPRQRIASVGYAIRAEKSEDAEKLAGKSATDLIQVGSNAGGDLTGVYPNPTVAPAAISQAKLKTAVGEIAVTTPYTEASLELPGGEYGFYPQIKVNSSARATILHWSVAVYPVYTSRISVYTEIPPFYVKQRYVTSSGKDWWAFLLVDKNSKEIISVWSAPDHPSYGNGGDSESLPHPFANYDSKKHEIVLLDKKTCNQLKKEELEKQESIPTLINEEYKLNMLKEEVYQPLHSGKFIDTNPVLIKQIPSYIKVRELIKLSAEEKVQRAAFKQQTIEQIKREKQEREQAKITAASKLKNLGLTENEIKTLVTGLDI